MPLKATWKTFSPSYLSPLTSLRRVTLKPNFSQDYIIFSLSVYSRKRLFHGTAPLAKSRTIQFLLFYISFWVSKCGLSTAGLLWLTSEGLFIHKLYSQTWVWQGFFLWGWICLLWSEGCQFSFHWQKMEAILNSFIQQMLLSADYVTGTGDNSSEQITLNIIVRCIRVWTYFKIRKETFEIAQWERNLRLP